MRMKNKAVVLLLALVGCHDFAFNYFGSPYDPTNYSKAVTVPSSHGDVVSCVKNEQCDDGLVCVKQNNNYIGACASVK